MLKKTKKKSSYLESQKGFTLVEMLVSVLIFSIVMGALIGIFASTIRNQRYSLAYNQLLEQTSFNMEYMSRMMRMARKELSGDCNGLLQAGQNYFDLSDDNPLEPGVLFKNYKGDCKRFFLRNGVLYDYDESRSVSSRELPLTSNNVEVINFNVNIEGGSEEPVDTLQPRVTIFLEIEGKDVTPLPRIKIQTTVSQRDLDVNEVP